MSAADCAIDEPVHALEVSGSDPAGPVDFLLTPREVGTVRVRIEVFQLVTDDRLVPLGGMYFDRSVTLFPTPANAALQTLATTLRIDPGQAT